MAAGKNRRYSLLYFQKGFVMLFSIHRTDETTNGHGRFMDTPDEKLAAMKMSAVGGGAMVSAMTLNEWVSLATLLFIMLQIGLLVPKYIHLYKKWREAHQQNEKRHE